MFLYFSLALFAMLLNEPLTNGYPSVKHFLVSDPSSTDEEEHPLMDTSKEYNITSKYKPMRQLSVQVGVPYFVDYTHLYYVPQTYKITFTLVDDDMYWIKFVSGNNYLKHQIINNEKHASITTVAPSLTDENYKWKIIKGADGFFRIMVDDEYLAADFPRPNNFLSQTKITAKNPMYDHKFQIIDIKSGEKPVEHDPDDESEVLEEPPETRTVATHETTTPIVALSTTFAPDIMAVTTMDPIKLTTSVFTPRTMAVTTIDPIKLATTTGAQEYVITASQLPRESKKEVEEINKNHDKIEEKVVKEIEKEVRIHDHDPENCPFENEFHSTKD